MSIYWNAKFQIKLVNANLTSLIIIIRFQCFFNIFLILSFNFCSFNKYLQTVWESRRVSNVKWTLSFRWRQLTSSHHQEREIKLQLTRIKVEGKTNGKNGLKRSRQKKCRFEQKERRETVYIHRIKLGTCEVKGRKKTKKKRKEKFSQAGLL